ncbi:efflux RND transporter permease subunit [candidate division KSB1 bacterium]
MNIPKFSVRNSVFVNLIMILMILAGLFALFALPRELMPKIDMNWVFITTIYPGVSPEEIEELITKPIEDAIESVDKIDFVSSVSEEGQSGISVKFENIDPDEFDKRFMDLRAEVDAAARILPKDAEDPYVMSLSSADFMPMISINLSSDLPEKELKGIAEELEDDIKQIKNVSKIEISGLRDREIWIEVDPGRMNALNVTFDEIVNAIGAKNLNIPGGTLKSAKSEFVIRIIGKLENPDEIKDIIVRINPNGGYIKIENVAEVLDTYKDYRVISRLDQKSAVSLSISKKENGNSIEIIDQIKEIVAQYQERYNKDVKFTITNDTSIYINDILGILQSNALMGLFLVIFLLWVFLGKRNALMAAIGIPITFLFTFLYMYVTGRSLNGHSIFGLVLVLGMVVDDAVVVIENCYRYIQKGIHPKRAAVVGACEVGRPIFASVATTIAAFLPLVLMPGVMGRFMRIIPIVVTLVLAASLFEAFFILPAHIGDWSKRSFNNNKIKGRKSLFEKFRFTYLKILKKALRKRYWVVAGVFVLLLFSLLAIPIIGVELFYGDEFPQFFIHVRMPEDYKLEETDRVMKHVENIAMQLPEEERNAIITTTGLMQTETDWVFKSSVGQIAVDLVEKKYRKRTVKEIIEELREKIGNIAGVKNIEFFEISGGPPVGAPVEVKVKGKYFNELERVTELVKEELAKMEGVLDIKDDFEQGKNELQLKIDEEKAAFFGLNTLNIASSVRNAYLGIKASVHRDGDEEIDVVVKFNREARENLEDFKNIRVATFDGRFIPLKDIADLEIKKGYSTIRRFDGERSITVTADIDDNVTSAVEVNNKLIEKFKDIAKEYPGYKLDFRGEFQEYMESFRSLGILFIFGIILIYMILGGQFQSFVQPIIIIFTIPFAFMGAIFGLLVDGNPFSIVTLYGIVALAGIAVNSSIVLVDFINRSRQKGHSRWKAIMESGYIRLRPIFLTTATTVGGLLPMALGLGGKSIQWGSLANTIVWGLIFSSTLTLVVIPCVYVIVDDIKHKLIKSLPDEAEKYRIIIQETES